MASYTPLYNQTVIWIAGYDDGSILREWDDSGEEHSFNEIDKKKLRKFYLISANGDCYFDCKTGVFRLDGRDFVFPLAGLDLNYAEGLIHYKEAFTEFVSAHAKKHEYDGFEIGSYNMGWKVKYNNLKSQVILTLPEKIFSVELTFLDLNKTVSWKVKI